MVQKNGTTPVPPTGEAIGVQGLTPLPGDSD